MDKLFINYIYLALIIILLIVSFISFIREFYQKCVKSKQNVEN